MLLPHKMAVPLLLASEQLLSTLHKGTSVVVVEEEVVSHSLSSSHGSLRLSQSFRLLLSSFDWSGPPALLLDRFVCLLVSLNILFCGKLILFSTAPTDEPSLFVFFLVDWILFFFFFFFLLCKLSNCGGNARGNNLTLLTFPIWTAQNRPDGVFLSVSTLQCLHVQKLTKKGDLFYYAFP